MNHTSKLRDLLLIAAMTIIACGADPGAEAPPVASPLTKSHKVAHREAHFGVPTFVWLEPGATPSDGQSAAEVAQRVLTELAPLYHLRPDALAATSLRGMHDTGRGTIIAHFAQQVAGHPVFRLELAIALDRSLRPVAASGYLAPRVRTHGAAFLRSEAEAQTAATALMAQRTPAELDGFHVTNAQPTRTQRIWFPRPDGLVPAYYIELDLKRGTDSVMRSVVISAHDGGVLFEHSLTANDANTYRVFADKNNGFTPWDGPQGTGLSPHPTGTRDGTLLSFVPSQLVTLQNAPFSRNDPWLPSGATEARGNNAVAYADLADPDGLSSGDLMLKTTSARTFDYSLDVATQDPAGTPAAISAVTTNLFYVVNFMHDYFYDAGFDESARNPQENNYGRGGLGGDAIRAEAQDVSARNNANASTPADGQAPRIQMYLYERSRRLRITAPAGLAADYENGAAGFGPIVFDVTKDAVLVDDGTSPSSDGCEATFVNAAAVAGNIAIIDRGTCDLELKVYHAQQNGASGVVIVNNDDLAPFTMGFGDPRPGTVMIPSVMMRKQAGDVVKAALTGGMTVTMQLQSVQGNNDSSLDGTILSHEWGHILSNRIIGNGNGLGNPQGEALGEGWSDFVALLTYVRPEDALAAANSNWTGAYPIGTYAAGPANDAAFDGSRRYPYSADLAKNPLMLRHLEEGLALPAMPIPRSGADGSENAEEHAAGEVWTSMLFDCYVALLRDTTRYTFAQANRQMREYLVASLKLTPINPTFLEARDALLAAAAANSQADLTLFAQAFARRGAGIGAIGPDRESANFSGITESSVTGADFAVVSVRVDDSALPCDRDGVLDNDEVGRLRVTLRNIGTVPLSATATVQSLSGNVTPAAGTLTFPPVAPFATTTATVDLRMQGASINQAFDLRLVIDAMNKAVPGAVTVQRTFRGNYDLLPNSSAKDEMEDKNPLWNVSADAALDTSQPWTHDMEAGLWSIPDTDATSDHYLISPQIVVGNGSFGFTLRHRYSFEADASDNYDGGVIEISEDGTTWQDLASALTTNGYNGQIYSSNEPLGMRQAFTADSPGYPAFMDTVADLGTMYQGKTVRLRFRVGTDSSTGAPGWELDSLQLTGAANTPFSKRDVVQVMCVNRAPIVNAGPDQTVSPGTMVTLAGQATDANGDALTYRWTQSGGPSVTLDGAQSLSPTFTAPMLPTSESLLLSFTLVANDGYVDGDPATVRITVAPAGMPTPRPQIPTTPSGCSMSTRAAPDGVALLALMLAALLWRKRRAAVLALFLLIPACGKPEGAEQLGIFVVKSGSGSGVVRSEVNGQPSAIDCGAICAAVFPAGTNVTLIATPAAGSEFTEWRGACTGSATTCQVGLAQSQNVEAVFNGPPATLTVTKAGFGTGSVSSSPSGIDCGATCEASYASETVVILTAAPDGNSVFTGWSGDCQGFGRTCEVRANRGRQITASFSPRSCSPDGVCWESPLPQGGTLNAIAAIAASDVWAAGERGTLLHWNGQRWISVDSGTTATLRGLFARATNDVWAVGDGGTALHFSGTTWTASTTGVTSDLRAVFAAAANSVYAVGAGGIALRFDGTTWSPLTTGAAADETLRAVHGTATNDVWLVSDAGSAFHFDGTSWSRTSASARRLLGVWAAAMNDVWAVGDQGEVRRWDGTMWQDQSPEVGANLRAVFGTSPNDVWVATAEASLLRWDGSDWSPVATPDGADFRAVNGTATNLWLAGSGGALARWDGAVLAAVSTAGPAQGFAAVWGSAPSQVQLVGAGGRIATWNGMTLSSVDSGVSDDLLAIHGSSASNVWAVGKHGTILHHDGAGWQSVESSTTRTLFAVFTRGPSDTWAVGALGTVLHHDGTSFTPVDSGARDDLYAVWASSASDVFIAGNSELRRKNGTTFVAQSGASFPIYALSGRSASDVWTAGANGALRRFDGSTWQSVESGTSESLRAIAFASSSELWIAGEHGVILRGGAGSFSAVKSGTTENLYSIWAADPHNIWMTGATGVLSYRR